MNRPAVESPNAPTEAVDAILRSLQDKLFEAHGVLSCARAKVEISMEEDGDRFAIEYAFDLALGILYEVASKTESVAIQHMADAWHPEPETETEEE